MIGRDDVLGPVLAAPPPVRAEPDEDAGELPHADAGTVAAHAVGLLADGRTDAVLPLPAVLERLHVEGDEYVAGPATVGCLEALQNHARRHGLPTDAVSVLLGPESARWRRGLEAFWDGRVPVVRAVD